MPKKLTSLSDVLPKDLMPIDKAVQIPPRINGAAGDLLGLPGNQNASLPVSKDTRKPASLETREELVGLNFTVPKSFRRDFKQFCLDRDSSLVDTLRDAFEALKQKEKRE